MLKVTQDSIKVMGSLTREQSLGLAADIQGWHADIPKVIAPNKKLQLVN
jgi:hypothetical protein